MLKISIIVPVYNTGRFLADCLDSLIEQDLDSYEIICINDGSTDNSDCILQEYAQKFSNIRVIKQENSGLSIARNNGIKASNGEYILFVDSDDYLEVNVLGVLFSTCKRQNLDILDFKVVVRSEERIEHLYPDFIESDGVVAGRTYLENYIKTHRKQPFVSAWSHVFKKSLIDRLDNLFIENRFYEDIVFTLNAYYKAGAVLYIPYHVYNYRSVQGSITKSPIQKRKILDMQYMAREVASFNKSTGIRVPMDAFFSGIRNQIIETRTGGLWREYKNLFDKRIFREIRFSVYRPQNKLFYGLAKIDFSFFLFYCLLVYTVKRIKG